MSDILSQVVTRAIGDREREARQNEYFNDPEAWANYMLGASFWSKQREVSQSLVVNKNVAVKAGHGLGKSFLVAVLICWWVDSRYPRCFVASTAPSTAQIGAIVWREVRRMYRQIEDRYNAGLIDHKLPGKINSDAKNNEWKAADGQLIGFGRKPPDGREDDRFQGIHDAYVLAVADEAVGLSGDLIGALGNITTNEDSRRILIANPTNPASYMGKIFKDQNDAWALHTISVPDSPNFTDEGRTLPQEVLDRLSGPKYVEDMAAEYGETSARYQSRVLGEFAFDVENALITGDDINPALSAEPFVASDDRIELGVDVARFGRDSTAVYAFQGGSLWLVDSWEKAATTETSARVHKHAMDLGASVVKIDAGGVGGGVVDQVVDLAGDKYTVVGMNSSGRSPDNKRWYNARAYWWDDFRARCRSGQLQVDATDDKVLDELMSVQYKFAPTGGLLIESKDDMRKRGVKSPDYADAAVFAAANVDYLVNPDPVDELNPGDRVLGDIDSFLDENSEDLDWFVGW